MTPEHWRKVREVFEAALSRTQETREAFLREVCAGDSELRREVETLLASADELSPDFLESHAAARYSSDSVSRTSSVHGRLDAGMRLGPYEILALVGAGGMGEVYKARDVRLDRFIAVKVLPSEVAGDPIRLQRFELEARAASSLNHPNILTVLDVGSERSISYIATELVSGRTLRDLIPSGPLPVRRILEIAVQIADGLASAHDAGIVHRDLKPTNVMVTEDNLVKILDFGLAKAAPSRPRANVEISARSTEPDPLTEPGVLLGTADYMSPEQASGQEVDYRSDQFALGLILYELQTGQRPFRRGTDVETLVAILNEEAVPLDQVRADLPAPLRWITERCLAKRPRDRFASTRDLARDLASLRDHLSEISIPRGVYEARGFLATRRAQAILVAAAALVLALYLVNLVRSGGTSSGRATSRTSVLLAPGTSLNFQSATSAPVALSPSGTKLVFGARDSAGKDLLWLRDLSALTPVPLAGTEGASYPFWAPDEGSVAFFADRRLRKVSLAGGPPETICEARDGRGGTWSSDGIILFAADSIGRISEVPAAGGEPRPVTAEAEGKAGISHRWPVFLPDKDHFLYLIHYADASAGESGIYLQSRRSQERRRLLPDVSNVDYSSGYLLFIRENVLSAVAFDLTHLRLTGAPVSLGERVAFHPYRWDGAFSVSPGGALAYQGPASSGAARLTRFDRGGKRLGTVGEAGDYGGIRISPDGKRCAVELREPSTGNIDLWVYDLVSGIGSRLTFGATSVSPVWSPDGSRIVFSSNRGGYWDLYQKTVGDPAETELVYQSPGDKTPTDWTRDGNIIFNNAEPTSKQLWEIWQLSPSHTASPILQGQFNQRDGCLSPDGRLLAYVSDESGSPEVYVRTFPQAGWRRRVSTSGGGRPFWRSDGAELVYVGGNQKLYAAKMQTGHTIEIGLPELALETSTPTSASEIPLYAASPDRGETLAVSASPDAVQSALTLVLDWKGPLRR